MCYWEKNIRKQIEIAFLLTDFFRILLNKLPLCSASSYSWTSSRKSNLELIKKKVQRLWRGCFFLFLIEAALLIDLSQYLNHPKTFCFSENIHTFKNSNCQQKGLKSCNLSSSPRAILPFFVKRMKEKFLTLDDLINFRHFFCTKT